jgi:hypothetical protein
MSPIGLTLSCKSPPHIQATIDSSSPFGHALTHIPAFGHTWTQGVNRCVLFLLENYFTSLRHQMTSERQNINWFGKCSPRPFISGTTQYSSFDLKISPWGTPYLTLALTMKVISDRPAKLISWVRDYVLLSHQVWSWSNKNTRKIRFLSVLWLGPILTLPFDLDSNHLVWWLLTP